MRSPVFSPGSTNATVDARGVEPSNVFVPVAISSEEPGFVTLSVTSSRRWQCRIRERMQRYGSDRSQLKDGVAVNLGEDLSERVLHQES
jgi:hypothetical protein